MKKYLLLLIALLLASPVILYFPTFSVFAENTPFFAYVPEENAYFYTDDVLGNRTGIFCLPETYYVKVVGQDGEYYKVEYLADTGSTKKLVGYCKKSSVIPVDYVPECPYLYKQIELTYYLSETDKTDFSKYTVECTYYGDYADGTKLYSYVLREGTFGYIPKPTDLYYDKNDEYARRKATTPEIEPDEPKTTQSKGKTVLLILLLLVVPVVSVVLLRPQKKTTADEETELI